MATHPSEVPHAEGCGSRDGYVCNCERGLFVIGFREGVAYQREQSAPRRDEERRDHGE